MMENMSRQFSEHAKILSDLAVDFRKIFVSELFGLALKQVSLSLLYKTKKIKILLRIE
jgi:hypothetical protein